MIIYEKNLEKRNKNHNKDLGLTIKYYEPLFIRGVFGYEKKKRKIRKAKNNREV